ncbi:MAG: glycosyltransferase, partial [Natronospirillum sp.]
MTNTYRVVHIISGDLWAGAEAQIYCLLLHLKPLCDLHAIVMNECILTEKLRACGVPVTVYHEAQLNVWQILLLLRRHLTELNPQVVHTHRQKENILGALANVTTIRAKCLRTVHGAPEFKGNWKSQAQKHVDEWIGRHLQQTIIAVSDALATQLTTVFPAQKVVVIKNGVDIDALKTSVNDGHFDQKKPHQTRIGIIGRLVPVKRVDLFLNIASQLNQDNYQFHIIGDGPLRKDLEKQAAALGLTERVKFHGHRTDIATCIAALDCVIMCSDHEGTPMTALETLALNTPLIANSVGGLSEILANQKNLLVTENTPSEYVTKILSLATLRGKE